MTTLKKYSASLINPFDNEVLQPKIFDGRVSRSSGIRLRATGEIVCDTSDVTYIALVPGLSNVLCWKTSPSTVTTPNAFGGHMNSATDRAYVKQIRTVGAALRLSLVNSALENEGYWEAARVPVTESDFTINTTTGVIDLPMLTTGIDLSNHQTYQTGKCRDLHRYQFKLNPQNTDLNFGRVNNTTPTVEEVVSPNWDMIIIKVHGRTDSSSPSHLMYDCVSCQEVIYVENTALSRLMTNNTPLPQMTSLLERTKYQLPGMLYQ